MKTANGRLPEDEGIPLIPPSPARKALPKPIELVEENICPCCLGKGYVRVVVEELPEGVD